MGQQNSCKTLIGVHLNMPRVLCVCACACMHVYTYMYVCVCVCVCTCMCVVVRVPNCVPWKQASTANAIFGRSYLPQHALGSKLGGFTYYPMLLKYVLAVIGKVGRQVGKFLFLTGKCCINEVVGFHAGPAKIKTSD